MKRVPNLFDLEKDAGPPRDSRPLSDAVRGGLAGCLLNLSQKGSIQNVRITLFRDDEDTVRGAAPGAGANCGIKIQ